MSPEARHKIRLAKILKKFEKGPFPTCKPGISFLCGRACLSVKRNCKKDPSANLTKGGAITPGVEPDKPLVLNQKLIDLAMRATQLSKLIPDPNHPQRVRLEAMRRRLLTRASDLALADRRRVDAMPDPISSCAGPGGSLLYGVI